MQYYFRRAKETPHTPANARAMAYLRVGPFSHRPQASKWEPGQKPAERKVHGSKDVNKTNTNP
eukprot:3763087-Amphidinium_carterae.2